MIGVLLLNTGTTGKPEKKAVAKYLRQFLMDPRVIDLPFFVRWPLVNLLIVPTRAAFSAEAYQKIWTPNGSPLLLNSLTLKKALSEKLGENYCVELGMRYGTPSIPSALEKLSHCSKIILVPLFPQYAEASTGSVIAESLRHCKDRNVQIFPPFYDTQGFIHASAEIITSSFPCMEKSNDFLLFSYHGLPERQNNLSTPSYSEQCYITSQKLAEALHLSPEQYGTAFQSRLGKTPWIKPYTDEYLVTLREKNIKNLFVACPSFVADCLETLEEVGMRLKEQWLSLGGENFYLSPCLNDDKIWSDWLASEFISLTSL